MNILLTGAFNYSKEQIQKIKNLGYNIVFIQNELEEININPRDIDVVVCNALFIHNDIREFKKIKTYTNNIGWLG